MIIAKGFSTAQSPIVIEEINEPVEIARCKAAQERGRRNSAWLQAHWGDLLPQAFGKFLAVAGEEAFIADTPEAAWAWADEAHPEDDAATVQYVRPPGGPRIYVSQG